MLPPRHEPLIDNLRGIVSSRVDMDAFLHHRVRPSAQGLARFVWLSNQRLCLEKQLDSTLHLQGAIFGADWAVGAGF